MIEITYRDALRLSLREALAVNPLTFLLGEDVGRYGGAYGVSRGFLEEFGPDRVRDTPLAESGFVGAAIGAAMGGMRPIAEIMTVNFALLALDQIVNNAATILHMSGGQINVPVVIRTTTGAGRQLAAQHSHSWEGWFAHVPGIKIVAPASIDDARFMLAAALKDPDPVIIFEHAGLFNLKGHVSEGVSSVTLEGAAIRRSGSDATLITYGGAVPKALSAAEELAKEGVACEVIDLRSLRPFDDNTILASVRKTGRVVIVDEAWRSGSLSAEIAARIAENAFYDLDAPPKRICGAEVPMPYAKHLEEAAIPQTPAIIAVVKELVGQHV
jgi:pyruvate dehydrogenase E1 component beta subunit